MAANVLEDISDALEHWSEAILDAESKINRTTDLRVNIINALQRQVLDGLISDSESLEIEYITDLWIKLYKSFLCWSIGAESCDCEALNYLLELFELKQISRDFVIQSVLQLCQMKDKS